MREIKFRVWDNVDYMSNPFTLYDLQSQIQIIQFTSDCPVMQYTGLKDKNGKEIYEGDILKVLHRFDREDREDFETIGKVEYGSGAFWINGDGYSILQHFHFNDSDREVIGNFYENPELIKQNATI